MVIKQEHNVVHNKQLDLTSAYLIPTNVFTHVAVTVNEQGFVRLYVNGQPDRADRITQDQITGIGTDLKNRLGFKWKPTTIAEFAFEQGRLQNLSGG